MIPAPWRRLRDAPWRRVDPLGPLLGLAAFAVFALHGFWGALSRDLGIYAYSALQVAEGVPPYESVLNRAGPLAHLVPWLGIAPARLVGVEELTGMRVVIALLSVGGVWALYALGRDLCGSRVAGAVSASALLTLSGVVAMAASGPRDKPIMLVFLIWALLALVRRSWLAAGALVALATLTWQPVFLLAAPTALAILATLRGRALRDALVRFTLGGAVPTGLCVLGFWLAGALGAFLEGFLVLPMRYTGLAPFARTPGKNAMELLDGFGPGVWLMLAGLITTLGTAVAAVIARRRHRGVAPDPAWVDDLALGIGSLAGVALCLRAFDSWPDSFALLPYAAVGAGGLVHALTRRVPARTGPTIGVAVSVLALVLAGLGAWSHREDEVTTPRAEVTAVLATLPQDATVMSVEVPQALVFSGRTNPTRHQIFVSRLKDHIDDTFPGGMRGFVAGVRDDRPTVIVTPKTLAKLRWLKPVLTDSYTEIGDGVGFTFFVDTSLGATTVARARDSLLGVRPASGD